MFQREMHFFDGWVEERVLEELEGDEASNQEVIGPQDLPTPSSATSASTSLGIANFVPVIIWIRFGRVYPVSRNSKAMRRHRMQAALFDPRRSVHSCSLHSPPIP